MFKEIMIDLGNVGSSGVNCKMVASKNVTSYEQHCQVPSSMGIVRNEKAKERADSYETW